MRVLIISAEVWRYDTNGGNVLSNIFNGIDAEFAQIYCNPGKPSNNFCKHYYQITDSMVINNIVKQTSVGESIEFKEYPNDFREQTLTEKENKKFYKFFRQYNFQIFYIFKELLWISSDWKNDSLRNFIEEFNPDIIFAPCYGSHFMLKLDRYVSNFTKKPLVSYISDDHYSLKQFNLSPIFWANRFMIRKNIRKTFQHYELTYTMTQEQKNEYSDALDADMKILRKGAIISEIPTKQQVNRPIRIIYAGSMYCGRWKTLIKIAEAIKLINQDDIKIVLHIYTGSEVTNKQNEILNDKIHSYMHGLISQEELKLKYKESDIALHVESLDLKNSLATRLSFSTKIVDCLSSGCAVMCIASKEHAGLKYLEKEDAAICIDDEKKVFTKLLEITSDPSIILNYYKKAYNVCLENHDSTNITRMINSDFQNIIDNGGIYEDTSN